VRTTSQKADLQDGKSPKYRPSASSSSRDGESDQVSEAQPLRIAVSLINIVLTGITSRFRSRFRSRITSRIIIISSRITRSTTSRKVLAWVREYRGDDDPASGPVTRSCEAYAPRASWNFQWFRAFYVLSLLGFSLTSWRF
jgi:hypothetical protein